MSKKIIIEFTEEDAEEVIELIQGLLDKVYDSDTNSEKDQKEDA